MTELLKRLGSMTRPLSARDLAKAHSVTVGRRTSPSSVERWKHDTATPDAFDILALARLAKTTVEEFMAGLTPPAAKRRKVRHVKPPAKVVHRAGEPRPPRRRKASGG